jgi:hypothetical protein
MQASSFSPFIIFALLFSIGLASRLNAEEKGKPEDASPKAPFNPSQAQSSRLPLPSPYDKMLAIEVAGKGKKIQWEKSMMLWDRRECHSHPTSWPLALGVKIADGLVAVKLKMSKSCSCATRSNRS